MEKWKNDISYIELVDDILKHEEFSKLKNYKHHGDNRLCHCIRVSYYSYLLSKKLKLDYKSVARAGLLHDFFFVNNQKVSLKERIKVLFIHPKLALANAKKYFELNKKEENIIYSHMFPLNLYLPTKIESVLVDLVDDYMAIYERYFTIKEKISSLFKKKNKHILVEEWYS